MEATRRSSRRAAPWIAVLVVTAALLPGCRRAPEQPPPTPTPTAIQPQPEVGALELPQSNPQIGVSLASLPPGLAVTLNTSYWVELTDTRNPSIQYSFIGIPPEKPGPTPSSVAEFEERVRESPEGRVLERGTLDTAFGPASWVSGTYVDDDGPVIDIHLFVPYPPDSEGVIVTSVCPPGAASVEDRLAVMKDLLTHVS